MITGSLCYPRLAVVEFVTS